MHGLDTIIRRNAEQAGREAAHAVNAGDWKLAQAIIDAQPQGDQTEFYRGYYQVRSAK